MTVRRLLSGVVLLDHKKNGKKMEKWKLVPPDGGWGWLVLFGATMVNILVPGTIKSFGVLFVEFMEAFESTPAEGMWIPALCYFLYSSLGKKHFQKLPLLRFLNFQFNRKPRIPTKEIVFFNFPL